MQLRIKQTTAALKGKTGRFLRTKLVVIFSSREPEEFFTFLWSCLLDSVDHCEVLVSNKWFPPTIVWVRSSARLSCSWVSNGWTDSGYGWAKSDPRGNRTWLGTWRLFCVRSNGFTLCFFEAVLWFSSSLVGAIFSTSHCIRFQTSSNIIFSAFKFA